MDEEKIVGGFRKVVQDFLVPELREVVGELKQMNKRLASVAFVIRSHACSDKRLTF